MAPAKHSELSSQIWSNSANFAKNSAIDVLAISSNFAGWKLAANDGIVEEMISVWNIMRNEITKLTTNNRKSAIRTREIRRYSSCT